MIMDLQEALKWADVDNNAKVINEYKSRKVVQVLAMHVRRYELWIKEQGEFTDTCTFAILGKVCEGCKCKRGV
jgi:hypothetical protein